MEPSSKPSCNSEDAYLNHYLKLVQLVGQRVGEVEVAKDIVQDTFVGFEQCCQSGRSCDYPKSYLYRMALNKVADYFRQLALEKRILDQQEDMGCQAPLGENFPCNAFSCAFQYLENLSSENQYAFIQADIEHIPQTQIAHELGIPLSTLKSRVQRTRSYLKREFEHCLRERSEKS